MTINTTNVLVSCPLPTRHLPLGRVRGWREGTKSDILWGGFESETFGGRRAEPRDRLTRTRDIDEKAKAEVTDQGADEAGVAGGCFVLDIVCMASLST